MTVGVVVGNPKAGSRTLGVARAVASAAADAAGRTGEDELVVELAALGAQLLDWSSDEVRRVVESVKGCTLLVVASPTFKASYTGLLKCFLDWFGPTDLAGVVTVPVMVGAGAAHTLAVEVHLRPVLVELGAMLPTRGLYVLEDELGQLDAVIDRWLVHAGAPLARCFS